MEYSKDLLELQQQLKTQQMAIDALTKENTNLKQENEVSKQNATELTSYGKASLILAIFALIFGGLLVGACILSGIGDAREIFELVWFQMIGYIIGIFCSSVCAIVAGVVGIVAVAKSPYRTISWAGCICSIIILAFIIILVGYILLK